MSSLTRARAEGRRRIYLVRHADVSYFSAQGAALDTRTVPLNATGRAQAAELSESFRGVSIDRVVVSGLTRTRETAALLLAGRDLRVEECPELAEIRPGKMTAWAPRLLSSPNEIEEFFIGSLSRELAPEDTFLGGESFGDFFDRVVPAFERLIASPDWRDMLVVAHGGTNRALLAHMLGSSLRTMSTLEQDPACVNVIDVNPGGDPSAARSASRYLVRLLNFTGGAPLKNGSRMTTMEKIFMESRDAILAMAEKGVS